MLSPREEQEMIDRMTKIIGDVLDAAAERNGVPVQTVARQVAGELDKMAGDTERLKEACAEIGAK